MKLLIIRHGDPDYANDTLTERGHAEAALLAERLCRENIKKVYVSPMGRARRTAEYTLEKIGQEGEVREWLREFAPRINRPDNQKRKTVAWDWLPEIWTKIEEFYDKNNWFNVSQMIDGGVDKEYRWVTEGFDALLASHGYVRENNIYKAVEPNEDTIALFCHFGAECILLSHLIGVSPMTLWHGTCAAPTSVTTVITEERRRGVASFRICGFGDISHLYAGGMTPSNSARFCEIFDSDQRHN